MTDTIVSQGTVTSPPATAGWKPTTTAAVLRSAAGIIAARGHWRGGDKGVCVAAAIDEAARALYPARPSRARIEALAALRNNPQVGLRYSAVAEWEDRTSAKDVVALMRDTADALTATDTDAVGGAA